MSKKDYYPVQDKTPTKSFWDSENDPFRQFRSTPELPSSTDLVIVGSGFSGSSVSYYLSQYDSPPSCLMLEARDLCSGATGRNGGHCKPEYYQHEEYFNSRYGAKGSADIANFEFKNLQAVKELIETNQIDCDFVLSRAFNVEVTKSGAESAKKNYEMFLKNPYMTMKHDLFWVDGKQAEGVTEVNGALSAVSYTTGQLWPYKLMKALLKIALKHPSNFLNVQSHTLVKDVETLSDGSFVVHTNRGDVKTKKVVLCTNAYTPALQKELNSRIVPVKGTVAHIVPLDENYRKTSVGPYLNNSYIITPEGDYEYLINRPDGSVIVGGAEEVFGHDVEAWIDNYDDTTLFNHPVQSYYERFMSRIFRSWESTKTAVDYLWTGVMGYTFDSLPFVGEVPGESNKFVSAGFHGHGMPRAQ
ncbi:unnamed protein product [Ambrosiozyma monospora]|uniref:Unnamed protein product n=1 Tax=Ambrosiozyma monospora TaxID=43982 RepID=A0ACB5SSU7_AMBMO|nr:unnamed protein product [Ambrosiozyma monospora]